MSHRNARLTPRGRLLLVHGFEIRACLLPMSPKRMGISRQCAHRWVRRFDEEGLAGLEDRSKPTSSFASAHRRPP